MKFLRIFMGNRRPHIMRRQKEGEGEVTTGVFLQNDYYLNE